MKKLTLVVPFVLAAAAAGCSKPKPTPNPPVSPTPPVPTEVTKAVAKASRPNLTAFKSEEELKGFFADVVAAHKRDQASARAHGGPMASSATALADAPAQAEAKAEDKAGKDGESITNTQHAGVDEGGIVKVHGDHLVVLRRGRLFTVRIGDDALTPVAYADAFGPGIDPSGAWYDEMLVSGDTAIVVGYSYQRGGTEVGLFDLDREGGVKHRATYHLRSNDYYSSRNYASRVIGTKLVFYTPSYLNIWEDDPTRAFPAVRKWHAGATDAEFKRVLTPTKIYRPVEGFSAQALHTVTVCDLAARDMPCTATAVLGPAGRVFYVSEGAVYVWATDWKYREGKSTQASMVVRLPLDGTGPSALKAKGGPVDQFSFLEEDGHLNVVVRSDTAGDAMWAPEVTAGDVAMMRVPVGMFDESVKDVPNARYARLPKPAGYTFQNRFVGSYLLYGTGASWGYAQPKEDPKLFAYRFAQGGEATTITMPHPVDRIEALGRNAVVVGGDGKDLHFTAVALDRATPSLAGRYVRPGASQGETRSHGFFYKPDGDRDGVLGLPIRSAAQPGYAHLVEGSASVVFVRNQALDFKPMGELEAGRAVGLNDACRASCVDWYGNARPIFLRGRVFALMGYELVEGTKTEGRVVERRRVSFAPRTAAGPR
jgi:hypothetical protein